MLRLSRSFTVAVCLLSAPLATLEAQAPPAAAAQSGVEVAQLLSWITETPPDWRRGILYAVFGMAGALITVFGFVGGAVPGTAGKASIETDTERLERLSKRLEELVHASPVDGSAIESTRNAVNELRDDLRSERRSQFLIAGALYVMIGGLIAALLAQDVLQAIITGAAWTGVVGALGLKRDFAERKAAKNDVLERTLQRVIRLEQAIGATGGPNPSTSFAREPLELLERDVRAVQRL